MISASQVNIVPFNRYTLQDINTQSCLHTVDHKKTNMVFNGGASSVVLDIYDSVKNVEINNNSLLMLTKHKKINEIYTAPVKNENKKNLLNFTFLKIIYTQEEYKTTGFYRKNGSITQQSIIHTKEEQRYRYFSILDNNFIYSDNSDIKNGLFKLIFKDDYVFITNTKNYALTQNNSNFKFTPFTEVNNQKFHYILNDISIIIFVYNTNLREVLVFNENIANISIEVVNNDIPQNSIIYIENFKNINNKNLFIESFITKYETNALTSINTINVDKDIRSLNYDQEYLINIPYKNNNPTIYINSLKNYQTPRYEYSLGNNITKRREYTSIFTGGNRDNGHKNIYLNYTSNTLEKIFKPDTDSVFHYPATAPTSGVYLSAAGLTEDGAVAGSNPFTADRVGYNRSDYRELNLPSPGSVISDNTWQYAWLSAGDNGDPIWMDRHYFGAYYELVTQDYLLYTVRDPLIADVPSTMLFLPNRIYSYFHQGFNNIKKYTDNFNSVARDKSTKVLDITGWDTTILQDSSIFNNTGTICLNTQNLQTEYLQLNGVNYVIFPSSESLSESRQLTVGFWFKVEDWARFQGNQIFGNYSLGGYGLFNKQNIATGLFTLYDNVNNYIYNLNSQLSLINEQGIYADNSITTNLPVYIMRTSDYSYWLINCNNLKALKYDLNNNIIFNIDLSLKNIYQIDQVEVDGEENIYIFDNSTKTIAKFDSYTGVFLNNEFQGIQPFTSKNNFNRIEIIRNYTGSPSLIIHEQDGYSIVGIYAEHSVVDNFNNIWSSIGVNLYINNNLFGSIGKIEYITCDSQDNIWILHDKVFITKISSKTNDILFTKQFSDNVSSKQKLFINFITVKKNNIDIDYLLILCSQEKLINIVNITTGNIEDNIYLLALPSTLLAKRFDITKINFTAYGDFTGYQVQRKFNTSAELVWRVNVINTSNNVQDIKDYKTLEMPFASANFEKGWHYFNFVFNHALGYTAAYVDGIEVSRVTFKAFEYLIKSTIRPICIGAITTEQGILNDTIGINDKNKTIGSIGKLHIYNYAFNIHDINCLFKSTFIDMYKDLTWHINIGNRNYIEQIERFFKHSMPGNKSNYYNLKIKNFPATEEQRIIIEQAIRGTIKKIAAADITLNQIKWEY